MGEQRISFAQRYRIFCEARQRNSSATLRYLVDTCSLDYLALERFYISVRLKFIRTMAQQVSVLVFLSYYRRLAYAVEALVSDHLVNSKEWSYLELRQWSLTRAHSRKRSHVKTIEGGRL